ncbi:trimethylguanosine synthase 1 [Brevipalpus obovatus]|uniref:trimethylguanosine synthase 1 n=1 Tax=Brevipalpus obovatus TaxID=246614 RepID=UPI003D9DBF29
MMESLTLNDEQEMMAAMGLPIAFSSSKRPFHVSDDEEGDNVREEDDEEDGCELTVESTRKRKKNKKKRRKIDPDNISKYYAQRYRIFSLFDEGIQLDHESWYSTTPEEIARHIAKKCVENQPCIILDPFCGVGGNIIQFALASDQVMVIASDIDPDKVTMAKHNAKIYGVQDRISFLVNDFFKLVDQIKCKIDLIFLSPPWGGPEYLTHKEYSLSMMSPDGFDIYNAARKLTKNIAYLLPRNIDNEEINSLLEPGEVVEIEKNIVNKKTKTLTAYFGMKTDE